MNYYHAGSCDIAVIGAGHAGIEAALAGARLGMHTILFTINLDAVGNMPCNPLATPWTVAHQAPPSVGFSRQEYWSGVPLPSLESLSE